MISGAQRFRGSRTSLALKVLCRAGEGSGTFPESSLIYNVEL